MLAYILLYLALSIIWVFYRVNHEHHVDKWYDYILGAPVYCVLFIVSLFD